MSYENPTPNTVFNNITPEKVFSSANNPYWVSVNSASAGGWVGTATTDLNMNGHSITDTTNNGVVITKGSRNMYIDTGSVGLSGLDDQVGVQCGDTNLALYAQAPGGAGTINIEANSDIAVTTNGGDQSIIVSTTTPFPITVRNNRGNVELQYAGAGNALVITDLDQGFTGTLQVKAGNTLWWNGKQVVTSPP